MGLKRSQFRELTEQPLCCMLLTGWTAASFLLPSSRNAGYSFSRGVEGRG